MLPWWGKSSKDVKKKSNGESFIGSWHKKCIRTGPPRRQRIDTTSQKVSQSGAETQSPSTSKQVSRCQSFGERHQAQPLPVPSSHFRKHADIGVKGSNGPSLDRDSKTFHPLLKPGHRKIWKHAEAGERYLATASNSSDSSSDTDDPSESRFPSPLTSDYENGIKSNAASPSG